VKHLVAEPFMWHQKSTYVAWDQVSYVSPSILPARLWLAVRRRQLLLNTKWKLYPGNLMVP